MYLESQNDGIIQFEVSGYSCYISRIDDEFQALLYDDKFVKVLDFTGNIGMVTYYLNNYITYVKIGSSQISTSKSHPLKKLKELINNFHKTQRLENFRFLKQQCIQLVPKMNQQNYAFNLSRLHFPSELSKIIIKYCYCEPTFDDLFNMYLESQNGVIELQEGYFSCSITKKYELFHVNLGAHIRVFLYTSTIFKYLKNYFNSISVIKDSVYNFHKNQRLANLAFLKEQCIKSRISKKKNRHFQIFSKE